MNPVAVGGPFVVLPVFNHFLFLYSFISVNRSGQHSIIIYNRASERNGQKNT